MAQKQESFKQMLAIGIEGEHEIGQFLLSRGVSIMPLYQFTPSEAPVILSGAERITMPDLICFKDDCFFVEVKTKNQWVVYGDRRETGLNRKHYKHYKKIKDSTGKKVYVFFNHKKDEPLGYFYTELDLFTRGWDGKNPKGEQKFDAMVFYDYNTLKQVESFSNEDLI